jgi:hypothetical protein
MVAGSAQKVCQEGGLLVKFLYVDDRPIPYFTTKVTMDKDGKYPSFSNSN